MTAITVHGRAVSSFNELVERFPHNTFASPRRSTIPLLDYWRVPDVRLDQAGDTWSVSNSERVEFHFEFEIPTQSGRGKSSFTDLMIVGDESAVAVEAKFTEPRYESVATWLSPTPTTNRADVLEGWIRAIEAATARPVDRDLLRSLPYQLIHRTASVCCVRRQRRIVVYQIFGEPPEPYYEEDLRALARAIGDSRHVEFFVVHTSFSPESAHERLLADWDAGERHMDADVRKALIAGPLLKFGDSLRTTI
jgi:hypothetical protein